MLTYLDDILIRLDARELPTIQEKRAFTYARDISMDLLLRYKIPTTMGN